MREYNNFVWVLHLLNAKRFPRRHISTHSLHTHHETVLIDPTHIFSFFHLMCVTVVTTLSASVSMVTSLFLWPLQLHYLRLPKDISEDHVILMDSTVSTGAAAMMAIRVLLVRTVRVRNSGDRASQQKEHHS